MKFGTSIAKKRVSKSSRPSVVASENLLERSLVQTVGHVLKKHSRIFGKEGANKVHVHGYPEVGGPTSRQA